MTSSLETPRNLVALFLATAPAVADGNDIAVDAGRGPIRVHVPDSYTAGTPAPSSP